VVTPNGNKKAEVKKNVTTAEALNLGMMAAEEILKKGGAEIVERIRNKGLSTDGEEF